MCRGVDITHLWNSTRGMNILLPKDIPTIGVFDDDEEEDGGGGGDCEGCNLLFISYKF